MHTCVHAKSLQLCPTLCNPIYCQAPLFMGFCRQEYWSGLPFTSPGDLPDPGIQPASLTYSPLAGGFFTTSSTWEVPPLSNISVGNLNSFLLSHNTWSKKKKGKVINKISKIFLWVYNIGMKLDKDKDQFVKYWCKILNKI